MRTRTLLKAKIKNANVHNGESLIIGCDSMREADLLAYEKIEVPVMDNGTHICTHLSQGEAGKGESYFSDAVTRIDHPGDVSTFISHVSIPEELSPLHTPIAKLVDD